MTLMKVCNERVIQWKWKVDCSIMELIYVGITNLSFACIERVRMPSVNRIIDVRLPCMAGCGQDTRLRGCRKG